MKILKLQKWDLNICGSHIAIVEAELDCNAGIEMKTDIISYIIKL